MLKTDNITNTIDKNKEIFNFHPRKILTKIKSGSLLSKITSRDNTKRTQDNSSSENIKLNPKESTLYETKKYPPVFFYRKISSPYKYNISSIPEYLVKTNEERHFMERLNKIITKEEDRNLLNTLINKKEKETKFKDRYKPAFLNVQTILRYRPSLYCNSLNSENRSNSVKPKDNLFFRDEPIEEKEKEKKIKENFNIKNDTKIVEKTNIKDKQEKNEEDNNNSNNNNGEKKDEKKEDNNNSNNGEKKDEIKEDNKIKHKYKICCMNDLKNENVINNKIGENHLFNNFNIQMNKNKYRRNFINNQDLYLLGHSQSQGDLIQNNSIGTKMNSFSSVSYNILAPLYKGFNKFITPSELNKDNKYNESRAFHRVKSISNFMEATKLSTFNTLACDNKKKIRKLPYIKLRSNKVTHQSYETHIN